MTRILVPMDYMTRNDFRKAADSNGLLYRKGRKTPTLKIYEDGTIIRADIDLTITKAMTLAEARKALGVA